MRPACGYRRTYGTFARVDRLRDERPGLRPSLDRSGRCWRGNDRRGEGQFERCGTWRCRAHRSLDWPEYCRDERVLSANGNWSRDCDRRSRESSGLREVASESDCHDSSRAEAWCERRWTFALQGFALGTSTTGGYEMKRVVLGVCALAVLGLAASATARVTGPLGESQFNRPLKCTAS